MTRGHVACLATPSPRLPRNLLNGPPGGAPPVIGFWPGPARAQPTSTSVTPAVTTPANAAPAANGRYTGPPGGGWSANPVVLGNDYLTVTATMQPGDVCHGATGWVFSQPPQELAALGPNSDPNSWAVRNGGIPQSGNFITLTVQGRNGHTVVILSFGVKILSRAAPPAGTRATMSGGCGGLMPSFFVANLDKPSL